MTFDTDANNVRRRLHRSKLHFYRFGMGKKAGDLRRLFPRVCVGVGHSPFLLLNSTAKEKAWERASHHLSHSLDKAIEPVHCPNCGIYQPAMVKVLQKKFGKKYEPNAYAKLRVGFTPEETLQTACTGNTLKSYKNFMAICPTLSPPAEQKLRELR
jgi:hypothetical protein